MAGIFSLTCSGVSEETRGVASFCRVMEPVACCISMAARVVCQRGITRLWDIQIKNVVQDEENYVRVAFFATCAALR